FDIDSNGIVHVSAKDKGTGKEQSIEIRNSSGLSDDEIDRMVREAEAHKAEDEKRKQDIETKNNALNYIAQIDETLESDNPNVTQEQKDEVKKLRDELQDCIDRNDMDGLKAKLDMLERAANEMAKSMYQQQNNGGTDQNTYGDDVVDADFRETK
ncbi:MAG: Hsp70 family protein, partial [Solobacterium sp.]|nr:Hsp70 family protein [Solobacterium sp.]